MPSGLSDEARRSLAAAAPVAIGAPSMRDGMPNAGFGGAPEDHELSAELRKFVDAVVVR